MKRKRILSLLLALTVMATMLMAVPLTANAAETTSYTVAKDDGFANGDAIVYVDGYATVYAMQSTGDTISATSLKNYTNAGYSYSYVLKMRAENTISNSTSIADPLDGTSVVSNSGEFLSGLYLKFDSDATVVFTVGATSGSRYYRIFDNINHSTTSSATIDATSAASILDIEIEGSKGDEYIVYNTGFSGDLFSVKITPASTDPAISLNQSSIKCATGVETNLSASTANLGESDTYTVDWESSDTSVATVDSNGKVTAVAEGEATITASLYVNGSETASSTATCAVTVSDVANVTVTVPNTMKNITLTYSGEGDAPVDSPYVVESTDTIEVEPGTYTVSGENGADVTHSFTLNTTTLTAEAGQTYTVTGTSSNIASSLTIDYTKLYNTTVKFDMVNNVPESSRYINLEGADLADIETDTEGVYLTIDSTSKYSDITILTKNGKFNSAAQRLNGLSRAQVRGAHTYIYVPVVPYSTVTVSSSNSLFDCASDDVTESDGQVFTYTGEEETKIMLFVNSASDDYLYSITIDPPPSYEFGDFETDSGYYYNTAGDQTLGVIRFLQEFSGDTPTSYGFYFVDNDGNIETYNEKISVSNTLTGGFYGDLVDIASSESGKKFYALPFVTYGSTTYTGTFDADTHYGTANFDDLLSYNSYSDWKVGQVSSTDTDGAISVTEKDGKTALSIDSRNAYYTLDNAISEGTVTFSTDVYIDTTSTSNLFRIYLENSTASNYQGSDGVMAQVLNARGGAFRYGPTVLGSDGKTDAGTEGYGYTSDESGWYTITITVDYSIDPATDGFITVKVVNPSGTEVLNEAMASVLTSEGADNALNQIRLIKISDTPYFANMKITTAD